MLVVTWNMDNCLYIRDRHWIKQVLISLESVLRNFGFVSHKRKRQ